MVTRTSFNAEYFLADNNAFSVLSTVILVVSDIAFSSFHILKYNEKQRHKISAFLIEELSLP